MRNETVKVTNAVAKGQTPTRFMLYRSDHQPDANDNAFAELEMEAAAIGIKIGRAYFDDQHKACLEFNSLEECAKLLGVMATMCDLSGSNSEMLSRMFDSDSFVGARNRLWEYIPAIHITTKQCKTCDYQEGLIRVSFTVRFPADDLMSVVSDMRYYMCTDRFIHHGHPENGALNPRDAQTKDWVCKEASMIKKAAARLSKAK